MPPVHWLRMPPTRFDRSCGDECCAESAPDPVRLSGRIGVSSRLLAACPGESATYQDRQADSDPSEQLL